MKDMMDFLGMTGVTNENVGTSCPDNDGCICLNKLPIAYSYTPMQELDTLYSYNKALESGTIFPELDLPKSVYGKNFCKKEDK